jgi:Sulfotransferase domain
MLPNLIIIGAGKCGTTSLHQYLSEHPDIFMSHQKELQFFQLEDWEARLGWYEAQFPVDSPVRGEASPIYTMYPFVEDVPRRIHSVVPDAKLIYLVRDPVDRLLSHYVEHRALRVEMRPFGEVLADTDPRNECMTASRYATQLEQYLEWFPMSNLLVLEQDELRVDRRDALRRIFAFLDVDESFWTPAFEEEHNTRKKVSLNGLGRWLYTRGALKHGRRLDPHLPQALRRAARRVVGEPVTVPEFPPDARKRVAEALAEETQRFRALTGRQFPSWSV